MDSADCGASGERGPGVAPNAAPRAEWGVAAGAVVCWGGHRGGEAQSASSFNDHRL